MRKSIRIWHIEDDDLQQDFWRSAIQEDYAGKIEWESFDTIMDACLCHKRGSKPTPDYVIFDVGSIGLMQADQTYLSAFHALRDHFPHTPIFLVSGLAHLPAMIRQELPGETLIYPITDNNPYGEVSERLARLEGLTV